MHVYPIRLVPRIYSRIWGGDRLERRFARTVPDPGPVGESWEVHGELPVANGPYRGLTLDEVARREGEALLGRRCPPAPTFPLLVKWLDCHDWLSVQVHPDDEVARRLTGDPKASGKTECWYIVEAGEDSELIHDLAPESTVDDVGRAQGADLLPHLQRVRARAGEVLFTPAGTVHALGPDLLLLEVQQSSDLTYRLYDWDRLGLDGQARPLHREEALEAMRSSCREDVQPHADGVLGEAHLACSYFSLESLATPAEWSPAGESLEILALVHGRSRVEADGAGEDLRAGDVVVVPASAARVRLDLEPGSLLLRARMPALAGVRA